MANPADVREDTPAGLWPWEAEPYRLWSPLDMLRHYAGNFMAVVAMLERVKWTTAQTHAGDMPEAEYRQEVARILPMLTTIGTADLPFSLSLRRQARRLADALPEMASKSDLLRSMVLIDEVLFNIQAELEMHLFLCIPEQDRELFEQKQPPFGDSVDAAFPGISAEIAAAARCLALDEATACVFHLMRIAEAALRRLADDLGVTFQVSVELENWKNIIDAIEKRIRAIEQEPKSLRKTENLKRYSAAAVHFRWIKDAWRNHVAHVRVSYTKPQAAAIFDNVRGLIQGLALQS